MKEIAKVAAFIVGLIALISAACVAWWAEFGQK